MPIRYRTFKQALDDGASCRTLYALRDELTRDDDFRRANEELRRIGCGGPDADRTDQPGDPAAYSPDQYQRAYETVAMDPAEIFREAGTDDPDAAARWYADTYTSDGTTWNGAYNGCRDALTGRPNRFADE